MATTRVTPDDLDKLKKAIETLTNNISIANINNGNNWGGRAFHDNGTAFGKPLENATRDEWDEYIKQLATQTAKDKVVFNKTQKSASIDKEIEKLKKGLENASNIFEKRAYQKEIKKKEGEKEALEYGLSKADARKQGIESIANGLSKAVNGIAQAASGVVDWIIANRRAQLAQGKNMFEKTQKIFQANLEMSNKVASNIIATITSFTTQTATDAAQSLTKGVKEEANARIKLFTQVQMAEREYEINQEKAQIEKTEAHIQSAKSVAQGVSSVAGLFGGWGQAIGAVLTIGATIGTTIEENKLKFDKLSNEQKQIEADMFKQSMENFIATLDKLKNITDGIDDAANSLNKFVRESDDVYKTLGLNFGWTGDKFASVMRKTAIETAQIFGTTTEEMKTMQENFINNSNRSIMLTGNEFNQMTAISKTFGISQGEVASIMGTMNLFNVSINEGYNKFDMMYHTITKMGLSTTKFAKDLNNNLKLAQKYNFKGGVDNMMKLTKWAQQTRFNLNSAASFADSIVNDSLSGALEKSAKLQVLGGNAAIFSDPLGMLYDAGADVGSMAQRMASMFGDVSGTFNTKTGETDFSWYENKMINERAKALGMDPGEVKDMIRQSQKQGVIDKLIGNKLDEEDRVAIGNRAQYVNGEWMVNTRNGQMKIGDLAALTKEQREEILLPENQEDAIMEIAENTRGMLELEKANLGYNQAKTGSSLYSTAKAASEKNIISQNKLYNSPEYLNELKKSIGFTSQIAEIQVDKTLEFLHKDLEFLDNYREFVKTQVAQGFVLDDNEKALLKAFNEKEFNIETVQAKVIQASMAYFENLSEDDIQAKQHEIMFGDNKGNEYLSNKYLGELSPTFEGYTTYESNGQGPLIDPRQKAVQYNRTEKSNRADSDISIGPTTFFQKDGIGYTNGGYITGATNVKPINDGAVNVRTAPSDQYLAAMPNGPIDKILQQLIPGLQALIQMSGGQGTNSGEVNVNLGGKIDLTQSGSTVNLVEIMRNDPSMASRFIAALMRSMEINETGKPSRNYKV